MKKALLIFVTALLVFSVVYFVRLDRLAATGRMAAWKGMDLWQGTWISEKTTKSGDFRVAFKKDGSNLTGNIKISGSPITRGGDIKGTIKGDKLEFGLVRDKRGYLNYVGTISKNTMSGTWEIPAIKDSGTWQATRSETRDSSGG